MIEKISKNVIAVAIIIGGMAMAGALVYINQIKTERTYQSGLESELSSEEVSGPVLEYIKGNLVQEGTEVEVASTTEKSGVYEMNLIIGGQPGTKAYASKDGEYFFPYGIPLEESSESDSEQDNSNVEVPKTETPDVKLFVMSYCPYGLKAQKMFLPVYDLLKDEADMGVHFVDYAMHDKKELDENLRQYCIQKNQRDKHDEYLDCFIEDGNSEECLSTAGINQSQLSSCVSETDEEFNVTANYNDESTWKSGYPTFNVEHDLNEEYGVQGSPTVVINDTVKQVSPRSPENFKSIICEAFESKPEECSQTLSEEVPSTGLGWGTSSGGSGGACE